MPRQATRLTEWNERMHAQRIEAGLTLNEAIFRAWNLLPEPYRKAPKMLERYETNWAEDKADPIFIAALADVYGCGVSDLSAIAAERVALVASLGGVGPRRRSRCFAIRAGQDLSPVAA